MSNIDGRMIDDSSASVAALESLLQDALEATRNAAIAAIRGGASETHDTLAKVEETLSEHAGRVDNPHSVSKAQVGLGNVDNTSDSDKPISTAVAAALAAKATPADITTAINALKGSASSLFDTLEEIEAYIVSDQAAGAGYVTALGNRVRVDAAQGLTAAQQAQARSNVSCAALDASAHLGLMVNPFCEISQERGTSAVSVTGGGVYTIDQMLSTTIGTLVTSWQQVTDPFSAIAGLRRLRNALKVTITTPESNLAAGSFATIAQPIEGTFWRSLAWGTADAVSVDIIAIVSASVAGNYTLTVRNGAQNRSYCTPVALAANTPTVVMVTIPGDVSGTWATDTSVGAWIGLTAACGATYQAAANAWQAGNVFGLAGAANLASTNGAALTVGYLNVFPHGVLPWTSASEITGEALVRLLGMRRPLDDELLRCQKLFYRSGPDGGTGYLNFAMGFWQSTTEGIFVVHHPAAMRVPPTFACSAAADFGLSSLIQDVPGARVSRLLGTSSGKTAGDGINLQAANTSTAWIQFNSRM